MADYHFDSPTGRLGSGCVKWDEHPYPDLLPMWVADMDFRTAPCIIEALQKRVAHGVFGYTHVPEEYYEAIKGWFQRRHQWGVKREWIQYTTGVVPALSVVIKALCKPGDGVILQTPVYNCFFSSVRNNGCRVVENRLVQPTPLDYRMDFDALEQLAQDEHNTMLVLCNPHNPVGRLWTQEELARVYKICRDNGVVLVSDEIHCELTFGGQRYRPLGLVVDDVMEHAVVLVSPSKAFNIAGLQVANIICGQADWRKRIDRAININEVCDINPFGVAGLIAAYNEGEPWLTALCDYIEANYDYLCRFLADRLPQLTVAPLQATYLAWINIASLPLNSKQFTAHLLSQEHVQVSSGTLYGDAQHPEGNAGEGFIRLNLACPRRQLAEALERIARLVQNA